MVQRRSAIRQQGVGNQQIATLVNHGEADPGTGRSPQNRRQQFAIPRAETGQTNGLDRSRCGGSVSGDAISDIF